MKIEEYKNIIYKYEILRKLFKHVISWNQSE